MILDQIRLRGSPAICASLTDSNGLPFHLLSQSVSQSKRQTQVRGRELYLLRHSPPWMQFSSVISYIAEPKNSATKTLLCPSSRYLCVLFSCSEKLCTNILYVLAVFQPKTNERIFDWSEVEVALLGAG